MTNRISADGQARCTRPISAAALLAVVGFGITLAATGVQPFGHRSMVVVDAKSQYVPFIVDLHHALTGNGSPLFTWASLGTNFMGNLAYYLASPLTLVVALVPASAAAVAFEAVTVAKIGLAAATMCAFLLHHAPRRVTAVVFAVAYALMAYDTVYSVNIMWLDAVYLLPLICLAVDHMVSTGRRTPLAVVLAVTLLTCFYAGYSAVVFGGLYLVARCLLIGPTRESLRRLARHAAWYGGLTIIAVVVSSVLTLPMLLELASRPPQPSATNPWWPLHPGLVDLLGQHVTRPFVSLSFKGLPNISSGIAVAVFAVAFLCVRAVPKRVRAGWGTLLAVMAASLCVPWLTWAWQGFGETNWYLYRFSFVYSFVLVTASFLGFNAVVGEGRGLSPRRGAVVAGAAAAIVLSALRHRASAPAGAYVADALLCAAAVTAMIAMPRIAARPRLRPWVATAAIAVVALDAGASAVLATTAKTGTWHYPPASAWATRVAAGSVVTTTARAAGPGDRIVMRPPFADNDAMVFGTPGIESSTVFGNVGAVRGLHALGLTWQPAAHNWVRAGGMTPLSATVLGVGGVVSRKPLSTVGLRLVAARRVGAITLYGYRAAAPVPFGYLAPLDVGRIPAPVDPSTTDPFALAERMLGARAHSLAVPLRVTGMTTSGLVDRHLGGADELSLEPGVVAGRMTWTVDVARSGFAFAFVGTVKVGGVALQEDGRPVGCPTTYDNGACSLGWLHRGRTQLSLRIHGSRPVVLRRFDPVIIDNAAVDRFRAAMTTLQERRLGDRSLSGVIEASVPGVLVLPVPYDRGWSAAVDGRTVSVHSVIGAFLAVPVAAGRHRILLSYWPPGLSLGMLLSALGVGLILILAVVERSLTRRRVIGSSGTAAGFRSRRPSTSR